MIKSPLAIRSQQQNSTGEREDQVLYIVEDGVSSEEDILIVLEKERENDYCGAIGES